ncbi:MAG: aminopeptidase P N-terminal domain-containing protein [Candidatus Margulisiibacteriota bacterium]
MPLPTLGILHDDLSPETLKVRFKARRQALMHGKEGILALSGLAGNPTQKTPWMYADSPVIQAPLFLYLTGLNQADCKLIITAQGNPLLFLPPYLEKAVFWEGPYLGFGDVESHRFLAKIGFESIYPTAKFWSVLADTLPNADPPVWTYWNQSDQKPNQILRDQHWHFSRQLHQFLNRHSGNAMHNLGPQAWQSWVTLDEGGRSSLMTANRLSAKALMSTLPVISTTRSEMDIAGKLRGELQSRTPFGLSFPPIVASGAHAAILHYTSNDGDVAPNNLILIDFGAKWNAMPADISRTFPRSGRFNPLQKRLYDVVLSTQQWVEKSARPGIRISELNSLAWNHLEKALKQALGPDGRAKRPYQHSPHNVGHLIGYQVHDGDAFREYRELPLKTGMAITNEPGLYGTFEATINGKHYRETLGIRIEDTLYITANGCENLTPFPKTTTDIEALLAV